nr:hypothetical protein CFP56_59443 [Quercus suber]
MPNLGSTVLIPNVMILLIGIWKRKDWSLQGDQVIEASIAWTKPQFQASLPSCLSYLGVRRNQAQQSSCLPRTRSASFSSASIPLPLCLVTSGVSASSAQPSHSLRPAATNMGVPSVSPSRCLHLAAFNTRVPLARPSHCPHLVAFNMGVPSASPSRGLHLVAFNTGSSISTPFSLPSPCGFQHTLGTPTPSLTVAYGHDACTF